MIAGRYRKQVVIKSYTYATGTDGGNSPLTASTIATRWANIRTVSGSERFRLEQLSPEAEHVIELREYLSTVTEKMIVEFESRTFQIERVVHDEMKHRWTTLYCVELK